jgi:hypothetical protein
VRVTVGAAPAARIERVSGHEPIQSGEVSRQLTNPFVIRVVDADNNPVRNVQVQFSILHSPTGAAGQSLLVQEVQPAATVNATTDNNGQLSARMTLGSKAGAYSIRAVLAAVASQSLPGNDTRQAFFSATATEPARRAPARIEQTPGTPVPTGKPGDTITPPLSVTITDADGNPVPGEPVTFSVTGPDGAMGQKLSQTTVTTGPDGRAQTTLTLGDKPGTYSVSASVAGLNAITLSASAVDVDTTPPTLPHDLPDSGGQTNQRIITIRGTVADAQSLIAQLTVAVGKEGAQNIPIAPNFSKEIALQPGMNIITVRAVDALGNAAQRSGTIFVDDTGPQIALALDGKPVRKGDTIKARPKVSASLSDPQNIARDSIRITIDGRAIGLTELQISEANLTTLVAAFELPKASPSLTAGKHTITVEASDALGNKSSLEVAELTVLAGGAGAVIDTPRNFPNPFNPGRGDKTSIAYTLTGDLDIQLMVFNLNGETIARFMYPAGTPGGQAGYNEIQWDGRTQAGFFAGAGAYPYVIVNKGKIVARGEIGVAY